MMDGPTSPILIEFSLCWAGEERCSLPGLVRSRPGGIQRVHRKKTRQSTFVHKPQKLCVCVCVRECAIANPTHAYVDCLEKTWRARRCHRWQQKGLRAHTRLYLVRWQKKKIGLLSTVAVQVWVTKSENLNFGNPPWIRWFIYAYNNKWDIVSQPNEIMHQDAVKANLNEALHWNDGSDIFGENTRNANVLIGSHSMKLSLKGFGLNANINVFGLRLNGRVGVIIRPRFLRSSHKISSFETLRT